MSIGICYTMPRQNDESAHKAQKSHEVATRGFFYSVFGKVA